MLSARPLLLALLLPLVQLPGVGARGEAGAIDFEDAASPLRPPGDAAPSDPVTDAIPPLAAAVGGLVQEARSAELAAVQALKAEAGEARARAIERTPAVQLLRSRIDAARTAEALLRLENAELQQEISRWRDTASRVAAHEARVSQLLSLQAAPLPPAVSNERPAVSAAASEETGDAWASASLMQRAAQLLEAQPTSGLVAAGGELLAAPLLASALLLLCWWRGHGGAGAAKALACSLAEARPVPAGLAEARPLSKAAPPPRPARGGAAGEYGADGYGGAAHGNGGGTGAPAAAALGGASAESVVDLLRSSAQGLGRSAGLSPCAIEISDIQLSDVVTGGEVYVTLQVGAAPPLATEAVFRPQGRGMHFRAVLAVEAWRFGGALQLRVVDRYTSREVTAAQLELSARELLSLAESEEHSPVSFYLQRPGAPASEPPQRNGHRAQVTMRLRLLPQGLPPQDAVEAPPSGFVDEEEDPPPTAQRHDV